MVLSLKEKKEYYGNVITEAFEAPERCPACDHPQAHFEVYTFFEK